MASFRVLMVVTLLLLILSCSSFTPQHSLFVRADDMMIDVKCKMARVPETCIECLNSDPRSKTADDIGLTSIVLDCMIYHVSALEGNMSMLASNVTDAASKEVLYDCSGWFSCAKSSLYAATLGLKTGSFETAQQAARAAIMYSGSCGAEIGRNNSLVIEIPEAVVHEVATYEELDDVASQMIGLLSED